MMQDNLTQHYILSTPMVCAWWREACVCVCVLRYWYMPVCLTATTWHCCGMRSLLNNISDSEQNKSQSCLSFYTHAHSYGQHQSISVCVQWMLSVCKRVDSRRMGASHFIVFMRTYKRRAYTALMQPVCDGIVWAHEYWYTTFTPLGKNNT